MNPNRLELARKRRGLTKTALAKLIDVDSKTYRGYESGVTSPSPETVRHLAARLRFPVEFFFGDDIDLPTTENVSFRSMKTMTATKRDMALSQGAIGVLASNWLRQRFELPSADLPDLRHEVDPECAAETLRHVWGLGQLSIRNMIHLLEAKGIRVFSLSVQAKEVDAFSMWQDDQPFIFLNNSKSAEHSRFDAAHELGHLVLHRHGAIRGREPEAEAHQFASAFLMPRKSVIAIAPRFASVADLLKAKKQWGVSIAALNYRLHVLGLTSDWHYRTLCVEIASKGYRMYEPEEMQRETSLIIPKILADLYRNGGITRSHIASDLGISLAELEQLFFGLVMTGTNGRRRGERPSRGSALQIVK